MLHVCSNASVPFSASVCAYVYPCLLVCVRVDSDLSLPGEYLLPCICTHFIPMIIAVTLIIITTAVIAIMMTTVMIITLMIKYDATAVSGRQTR